METDLSCNIEVNIYEIIQKAVVFLGSLLLASKHPSWLHKLTEQNIKHQKLQVDNIETKYYYYTYYSSLQPFCTRDAQIVSCT